MNGEDIHDIKIYRDSKLMMTAGASAALYGWEEFVDKKDSVEVWLCEGEWDTLVLRECFRKLNQDEAIVVGVPGGTTFKSDWTYLFKDKIVHVLYDNDDTGKLGCRKVHNNISNLVKTISHLHWRR
jgi:hypothetical protein